MSYEYKTDDDKNRLLKQIIDAVCSHLDVMLRQYELYSIKRFFSSPEFTQFKLKIQAAKLERETDKKIATAREAIRHWDWSVKLQYETLPNYVRLLRDILDIFNDPSKRHDVWIKTDNSYVLATKPQNSLLPHEHITTEPREPREPEVRDITALLRELRDLLEEIYNDAARRA